MRISQITTSPRRLESVVFKSLPEYWLALHIEHAARAITSLERGWHDVARLQAKHARYWLTGYMKARTNR